MLLMFVLLVTQFNSYFQPLAIMTALPLSIVGAMIGFGIMAGGFGMVNWGKLGAVVLSWVISPVFSMILAFFMFQFQLNFEKVGIAG